MSTVMKLTAEDMVEDKVRHLITTGIQFRTFVSVGDGVRKIRKTHPDVLMSNKEIADLIVKFALAAGVPLELDRILDPNDVSPPFNG